jgi:signal transduction histidine kinase/transcriptional regulator with GAF, ATPase, and Fis domain
MDEMALPSQSMRTVAEPTAAAELPLAEIGSQPIALRDDRLAHLQALAMISQHISGTLDLDQLLAGIYSATTSVIDGDHFYIAFYDQTTTTFDLAYMVIRGERHTQRDRWSAREGLASILIRERTAIFTDDYARECAQRGIATKTVAGVSINAAWIGAPLIIRDTIIGVMVMGTNDPSLHFHAEHADLFATIASSAAAAIENARLYRRSEQQAKQLETLGRIGRSITSWLDFEQVPPAIMDHATDLLGVEEGSLLLTDPATSDLVFAYTIGPVGSKLRGQRLPSGVGIAGYVVTSGQSQIVNDVQRDGRFDDSTDRSTGFTTRSLLAVPLRGVSGVIGVIEVINRRDNNPFSDEDRRLLEALADYAVIAIENSRRFAQVDQALARRAQELARTNDLLQHNLRSLTALNALGIAIGSTLRSPDEVYRMTARGVVEMTGALGAWVVLFQQGQWRTAITVGPQLSDELAVQQLLQHTYTLGRPELITSDLPDSFVRLGGRAVLLVPLRAPRATLGCLCVAYAEALPEAPDRETVVLFATQAAAAVESMQLFVEVSNAHDQMASILASTREGVMLITANQLVAVANGRLEELCGLAEHFTYPGIQAATFFEAWQQIAHFVLDEWQPLQRGLGDILARQAALVTGELHDQRGRVLEWAALQALGSGESHGGALLVLRDITSAKEAERLRDDLTHMIVHDLRSPLSSVMASVDMMMRGVTGELNGSQLHVLNIANESSQQMLAMINTLLDINKLEAGHMPLERGMIDMCALAQRAASQLESLAQERRITIDTNCVPETPLVYADAALMVRVIQNLLANAVKFSGRGATINVKVAPQADVLLVSIQDRGIGIAPRDREKIFAKFGQVGERRGGTGLGLTFCKLVVEAHAGQIWVESEIGHGSTFWVRLPLGAE